MGGRSPLTTLCYLTRDGEYLMLYRNKKKEDVNGGKWIGVGGHFEAGESPEDCMKREIREEVGVTPTAWRAVGLVTFVSDVCETEYMHLFSVTDWQGEVGECDEGELAWVPASRLGDLPTWEGDQIFLSLMAENRPYFSLKLCYRGDSLTDAVLDGTPIPLK